MARSPAAPPSLTPPPPWATTPTSTPSPFSLPTSTAPASPTSSSPISAPHPASSPSRTPAPPQPTPSRPPSEPPPPALLTLAPATLPALPSLTSPSHSATGVTVLANDGAGNFTAGYSTLSALLPAAGQSVIDPFAVADANSDTYSDIYTASTNASGGLDLNVSLVSGSATATAAPITLGIGTKDVSAAWPGNVNFAASTATGSQTVQGVPVGVTVLSSKNPANLGDPVTFTISVAPLTASTIIPTGVVTVQQNGNSIGGGTLDPTGAFSLTTTQNVAGSFPVRAAFGGDNFFAGAVSTILTQVVNQAVAAAPTLTWPTPAPIPYGTPLSPTQLDAVATDADGTVIPGTFTYTPAAGTILPGGPQTLSVTFTPNDLASFLTATQTVVLNVLPAASATTLNVSASDSGVTSVPTGTVITLTANVNAAGLGVSPGQVHFCDASACTGTHLLGTAQLTRSGVAILNFIPGPGTHTYQAVFLGTNSVTQSSATASSTLTVTSAIPTTTTLQQTGTPGNYTLTATTTGVGPVAPSGPVSFLDQSFNNLSLAQATLSLQIAIPTFIAAPSPQTGLDPQSLATGDINGDGIADMVILNEDDNTISVLLGNGDGTFRAGTTLTFDRSSALFGQIILGDFNEDGVLDLAAAAGGGIVIVPGVGDGTFLAPVTQLLDLGTLSAVTGDFNQDGHADLAVLTQDDDNQAVVNVLLGKGDNTFTQLPGINLGGSPAASIFAGDFNADGSPDLVIPTSNGVAILTGLGDGTFSQRASIDTSAVFPTSVAIGDVNNDGKVDLIVTDAGNVGGTGALDIFTGNGDGTFTAAGNLTAGNRPAWVTLADFNADGLPDLAVVNLADNTISVFLGRGDDTFTALSTTSTGQVPLFVAAPDLNGDGVPDLVAVNAVRFGDTNTGIPGSVTVLLTQLAQTAIATTTGLSIAPGTHQVAASYPGDSTYAASLSTPTTLTGLQLTSTLNWQPKVTSIPFGTPLGALELDAVAVGPVGDVVPGTYTYTPPAGSVLKPGTHTLSVTFVPADPTIFTGATSSIQVLVTGLTSSSISPSTVILGAGNTTITLTGSGFSSSAVVQVNGSPIPSTVVSPTTLMAIVPATDFVKSGTLTIVVVDASISQTTAPLTLIVAPASPQVTLSGPSTITPGTQPTLSFALTNPYPVTLNGDFDLSFAPAVNPPVDDPAVQFATGGRTLTFTVPADSTAVPTVQLQAGTVAGTITVPLVLTANGLNVTPTSIQPVVIVIPAAVPAVSSATMTRSGDQLTVVLHGFSNTREVTQATFQFVGISGAQIDTPDVTVPVGPAFTAWYSSAASDQYGSTFTYTQTFTVGGGAASIDSVQVTLTNSVGTSVMQTAQ